MIERIKNSKAKRQKKKVKKALRITSLLFTFTYFKRKPKGQKWKLHKT